MNLLAFVSNRPINSYDRLGLQAGQETLKARSLRVLREWAAPQKGYIYYRVFGLGNAVDSAYGALDSIGSFWWFEAGEYSPQFLYTLGLGFPRIYMDRDADWSTVFHEGVHAHNYFEHYYDVAVHVSKDEGVAWTATAIAGHMRWFGNLEEELARPTPDPHELLAGWRNAWRQMNSVLTGDVGLPGDAVRITTLDDIYNVSHCLGVRVRCDDIRLEYNKILAGKGSCLRFSCDRPGALTRLVTPWIIYPAERIHWIFRWPGAPIPGGGLLPPFSPWG